jgi:hypothetical protein
LKHVKQEVGAIPACDAARDDDREKEPRAGLGRRQVLKQLMQHVHQESPRTGARRVAS